MCGVLVVQLSFVLVAIGSYNHLGFRLFFYLIWDSLAVCLVCIG